MAFVHSTSSRVFLNDKHVSGTSSGFTCSHESNLAETNNLLSQGATFIPGMTNGTLSFEGFIETAVSSPATNIQDAVRSASQSAQGALMTALPSGIIVGDPAFFCRADVSEFEIEASVDDAVSFSAEAQGYEGIDWGVALSDHTAQTTVGTDQNGTSVDNGSSTSNGGAAILHVTSASGTSPTLDVRVQHSSDDSTFTDLVTFTQATDTTQEFKEVASGTTVDQYVRLQFDISGTSPSFTFLLAFARR